MIPALQLQQDRDTDMGSEFFETRQAFLSLCQGNHYQVGLGYHGGFAGFLLTCQGLHTIAMLATGVLPCTASYMFLKGVLCAC